MGDIRVQTRCRGPWCEWGFWFSIGAISASVCPRLVIPRPIAALIKLSAFLEIAMPRLGVSSFRVESCAIDDTGDNCSDDRCSPKEPQLLQCPTLNENRWSG